MVSEYKVLLVEDAPSGAPEPIQTTLASLRDAVLKDPGLALQALRYALDVGPARIPSTSPAPATFGSLPLDAPIFKMLSPDQAKLLSPQAAKLTKSDLLDLAGVGTSKKSPQDLNLTIEDMKTIQDAFHQQFGSDAAGLNPVKFVIDHCCCTPCCCCTAAAVTNPVRRVA